MGTNEWPSLSSVHCQLPSMSVQVIICPHVYCLLTIVWPRLGWERSQVDFLEGALCKTAVIRINRGLHLPLFLLPSNLACIVHCVEFGELSFFLHVQTIGVYDGRLWGSRVVWLPYAACLMSSFLILCSLETPAIFHSQIISALRIFFSSCFRIVQHSDTYRKISCIIVLYMFILVSLLILCSSMSWPSFQILVKCVQFF